MGKIKSWSIQTKDNKFVYRPGETVSGTVTLEIEGELKVRNIFIHCTGQGLTKWRRAILMSSGNDCVSREFYVNTSQTVFASTTAGVLPVGLLTYSFNFHLPCQGLPSSFEGSLGAIRYWLTVEVDKPFPSINDKFYKCFTVLAYLDVNEAIYRRPVQASSEKSLSKVLGIGDAGTLTLTANLDRSGYCPGEKISISLDVKNQSSKDLGYVKATLVQRVNYNAGTDVDSTVRSIRTLAGDKLERGKTAVWVNQQLQIDAVPPSTKQMTSHIILVSYYVKCVVEVPLRIDLEVCIPIKIGTVPLGTHVPTGPRPLSRGVHASVSSTSLSYTTCKDICAPFDESFSSFVNLRYKPWTCFVRDNNSIAKQTQPEGASVLSATDKVNLANGKVTRTTGQATQSIKPSSTSTVSVQTMFKPSSADIRTTQASTLPRQPNSTSTEAEALQPAPLLPLQANQQHLEAPPSYEQACADSVISKSVAGLAPPPPELGSILMLHFSCQDVVSVGEYLKFNTPNLLLHDGKVVAFIPEIHFIPSQDTAALLIYFPSQRAALSWLQVSTSSNPELASTWLALIGENRVKMPKLGDVERFACVQLSLLKRNSEFKGDKAYWDEYKKLLTEQLNPSKLRHGALTILSGKVVFAFGDWSSFPDKASDLTFVVIQLPTLDHNKALWEEFENNASIKRFYHLMTLSQSYLFRSAFPTGDVSLFQDF